MPACTKATRIGYSSMRAAIVHALLVLGSWLSAGAAEGGSPQIFFGPVADYELPPPKATAPTDEVMRWVWVQERMQIGRKGAAVRVPVFFSAGECHDPGEVALVRWPSRESVPVQWDDVRRGPDGGVARLHLWFNTDLAPGENQRWALVKRSAAVASRTSLLTSTVADGKLAVSASGTKVLFHLDVSRRAALAALEMEDGPSLQFSDGAGAEVEMSSSGEADRIAAGDGGALEWASGPVFAKIVIRARGKRSACEVEQVVRIFSDGTVNVGQSVRPASSERPVNLKSQEFLSGRLAGNAELSVRAQPAGIVDSLLDVHRGYLVDGLLEGTHPRGWLVVPGWLGGTAGRVEVSSRRDFRVHAPGGITSSEGDARAGTVRAFWAEVTFIPARRDGQNLARSDLLAAAQPLVGIVDRPGVDLTAAVKRIEDNVREMKPVGWANETAVRSLNGRTEPFPKRNWAVEKTPDHWVAAAQKARAKVTGGSDRRLAEDEKGRAAGSLDPYHLTYGETAVGYWLMNDAMPEPARASIRAQLTAVRRELARTNEQGWPYLDVFARTQNMQMGPPFLALADHGIDSELQRFCRDQLAAPHLAAVMLRGLRPYEGRPQNNPVPSDELYQGVVDFFLRATELALNESLGLNPVAFGRYLDAIDVNADLYHPAHARASEQADGFARANFFRMQSHLHRWLNWGPAPLIALLQPPVADGIVPGTTEVWHYANALAGHWKNWPDQSWLFLAAKLPEKAAVYHPPPRLAAVKDVRIRRDGKGNHLAWDKDPAAVSYRIYRLRPKQPPVWLNSPYVSGRPVADSGLEWNDDEGNSDDRYRIHVVDAGGHESGW